MCIRDSYIDEHFVKVKPDVTPLIMCPTEYNKSWSDPAKGYLTTFGLQPLRLCKGFSCGKF